MQKNDKIQLFSIICTDIKKRAGTIRFLLASFIAALGLYMGTIGWGNDSCINFLEYSMATSDFIVFDIIAASFVASGTFCQDFHCGILPARLIREGFYPYIICETISCIISGGMVSIMSRVWFVMILLTKGCPMNISQFEKINNLYPEIYYFHECLQEDNLIGALLIISFCVFLFGGICAFAGMAFSAWLPNLYIAWFSPYIFYIIYRILMVNINQQYRIDFVCQGASVGYGIAGNIFYAITIGIFHILPLAALFFYGTKRRFSLGILKS